MNELRRRFINTSLAHFFLFLGLYEEAGRATHSNAGDAATRASELRAQFNESDPAALGNVDNWWSLILEQMEHGLL
jgi:hypothetical protein